MAGPGLEKWLSPQNAWAAVLALAWLVAIAQPVRQGGDLPRDPPVVADGAWPVSHRARPCAPCERSRRRRVARYGSSIGTASRADAFADWGWVHWLAFHPAVNSLVLTIALAALALFAAGVFPRVTYAIAMVALTARVFVVLQYRSAHDIGLPLVALWGLVFVPWDAALTARAAAAGASGRCRTHTAMPCGGREPSSASALLAAAYAKLDTSGVDWVLGGAAKYHFVEDFKRAPTTWGLWIATHPAWAVAASCGAVVIEGLRRRAPVLPAVVGTRDRGRSPGCRCSRGCTSCRVISGRCGGSCSSRSCHGIRSLAGSGQSNAGSLTFHPALRARHIVLVTALVCIQLFASARRVEVEPFVSDYGMYSWTWPSTDAFDRQLSRKYRVYHYVAANAGENR